MRALPHPVERLYPQSLESKTFCKRGDNGR
jgi:hypothetical protein